MSVPKLGENSTIVNSLHLKSWTHFSCAQLHSLSSAISKLNVKKLKVEIKNGDQMLNIESLIAEAAMV